MAELLTYIPVNGSLPALSLSNTSLTETYNITGSSKRSTHPQATIHNRMPLPDITNCQPTTDEYQEVPEQTVVETFSNISLENKAHYDTEKEAIH
ncbi:hypothetical protein Tco_1257815 [Tanacetum coccineum]